MRKIAKYIARGILYTMFFGGIAFVAITMIASLASWIAEKGIMAIVEIAVFFGVLLALLGIIYVIVFFLWHLAEWDE